MHYCPPLPGILVLDLKTSQWVRIELHRVFTSANKFHYQVGGRWSARGGADDVAPNVELSSSLVSIASLLWRSSSNSSRFCITWFFLSSKIVKLSVFQLIVMFSCSRVLPLFAFCSLICHEMVGYDNRIGVYYGNVWRSTSIMT